MCETNAYIKEDGREEMLFESLARVEVAGDTLNLFGVFGDRKSIKGKITEIRFQGGKLIIERL